MIRRFHRIFSELPILLSIKPRFPQGVTRGFFVCVFFCFLQPSCVSTYKYDTFDCRCKEGFFGHYCEKGK